MDSLNLEIKNLIVEVSGMDDMKPEEIKDDMQLFGDGLALDSIDALELVVNLDKNYGLKIRNNEEGTIVLKNVSSIVAAIRAKAES